MRQKNNKHKNNKLNQKVKTNQMKIQMTIWYIDSIKNKGKKRSNKEKNNNRNKTNNKFSNRQWVNRQQNGF
jgi:hypothetical protein